MPLVLKAKDLLMLVMMSRKITLTKHFKRTHTHDSVSPAPSTEDDRATSEPVFTSPAALFSESVDPARPDRGTPAPASGYASSHNESGWTDSPSSVVSVPTRASSRLSSRAPRVCEASPSPDNASELCAKEEPDTAPTLTIDPPADAQNFRLPAATTEPTPEAPASQMFRHRAVCLPPLHLIDSNMAVHGQEGAHEWDPYGYHGEAQYSLAPSHRHSEMRLGSGREHFTPLHRFDVHAPSPTLPQYL